MTRTTQHLSALVICVSSPHLFSSQLKQALRVCAPRKIVFDSPCKSLAELDFALRRGVTINANSYAEVQKIHTALGRLARDRVRSNSVIGLRVNPMVGAGAIDALSTATATSKFGVPSSYAGQAETGLQPGEEDLREKIIKTYLEFPFLTGIMCHVGSQGMPVESMVQGALHIMQLADEIDVRSEAFGVSKRITHVDIGGGLSANYGSDEVVHTFREYAQKLGAACRDLLRASPHRRIITEFGKAIITKTGVIATRVEEVVEQQALRVPAGGKRSVTAVVQAGADLLLRTAYCPDKFPHRLVLLDAHKQVLTSSETPVTSTSEAWSVPSPLRTEAYVTVAGPLCFSGDVLGRNLSLPEPRQGDVCLVLDAGANTLSLFSRHCSRLSPTVFAFRQASVQAPSFGQLRVASANSSATAEKKREETSGVTEVFAVARIREEETEADLLSFWG